MYNDPFQCPMRRYLITTADQRTWKFGDPVIFLGEWCRLYDARQVWAEMDAVVAAPYGISIQEKERDSATIRALYPILLKELAAALNTYHRCTHSVRYWHIIVGHWLIRYLYVVFNRYFTLEQALVNHEVSGTTAFDPTSYCLATTDSQHFLFASNDDVWNNILYSRILNYWGTVEVEVNSDAIRGVKFFYHKYRQETTGLNWGRRLALYAAKNFLPMMSKKHDAFIIDSYLPRLDEIKLQASLGQIPQLWLWSSPRLPDIQPDPGKRINLSIDATNHQGFNRFVRMQMADAIPSCYVEGYGQLVDLTESLPWPSDPQFIFTSNKFDADEVFKTYTASKVEQGAPYFVGAHGSFGVSPYVEADNDAPEWMTADKYFTWGITDDRKKTIPAFVFKLAGRKPYRSKRNGESLLLIECFVPYRKTFWDSYFEFGVYQEEQFRFLSALPERIRKHLIVRLHQAFRDTSWSDERRWSDRSPDTIVETGTIDIRKLIEKSRLVVHSYDSTGIPETLALNIPTMCFWANTLDHLFPKVKPFYQLLYAAGILSFTPEEAAERIASHWDNLDEWWGSKEVQSARKSFCEEIARMEEYPVWTLKRLLHAQLSGDRH